MFIGRGRGAGNAGAVVPHLAYLHGHVEPGSIRGRLRNAWLCLYVYDLPHHKLYYNSWCTCLERRGMSGLPPTWKGGWRRIESTPESRIA